MVEGIIYCGAIEGCPSVYELTRAQEWTAAALTRWVEAQPDLGNFTGECKVRRGRLASSNGRWPEALDELDAVSPHDPDTWAVGRAASVRGNLDRLLGGQVLDSAEEHFALAAKLGVRSPPARARTAPPGPRERAGGGGDGPALARGDPPDRQAGPDPRRGDRDPARDRWSRRPTRPRPTPPSCRASRRSTAARWSSRSDGTPRRPSGRARGAPAEALPLLREALGTWVRTAAPYEEARTRVLLAAACRALDDRESADRERETARGIFEGLGATGDRPAHRPGRLLQPRELEVLRGLGGQAGATNRAIAEKPCSASAPSTATSATSWGSSASRRARLRRCTPSTVSSSDASTRAPTHVRLRAEWVVSPTRCPSRRS